MFAAGFLAIVLAQVNPDPGTVYRTVNGTDVRLDIHQPEKPIRTPVPAVIVIHGGAWMGGNRKEMDGICRLLTERGLAAVNVSYRLAPKDKWPAMIDDVQAAVRYVRGNAVKLGIDPKRIGATGASAGGHLALLLAFCETWDTKTTDYPKESSSVKAVFNIFGPVDLSQDFNPSLGQLMAMQVLGKPIDQAAEDIKRFSPITHITAKAPPVFTLHGKADPLVPVKQSNRLDDRMRELGAKHTLVQIDGMKHEIDRNNPAVMKALADGLDFLVRELKD